MIEEVNEEHHELITIEPVMYDGSCHTVRILLWETHNLRQHEPCDPDEWEFEFHVKWDGCVNWTTKSRGYVHICRIEDMDILKRRMLWAYTAARKHLTDCDYPEGGDVT